LVRQHGLVVVVFASERSQDRPADAEAAPGEKTEWGILVSGTQVVAFVIEGGDLRVVCDEHDIGALERALPSIGVEHVTHTLVRDRLEVPKLTCQAILRHVGEDVDPRKVDDLKVRHALLVDGRDQLLH
jgi:hypothetical protein